MRLRVLKSILNEEFKNVQPGLAADENFLRLRFLLSESYATRLLLHLVKEGAIILYGGFKYDRKRILQLLHLIEGPSPSPPSIPCSTPSSTPPLSGCSSLPHPSTQSILKPQPAHSSPSGFNHSSTPPSASSASNSRCSSRSLPVKKLRWDQNLSPLKNPFIESEGDTIDGYDSAASSSSVQSVPSPLPPTDQGKKKNCPVQATYFACFSYCACFFYSYTYH